MSDFGVKDRPVRQNDVFTVQNGPAEARGFSQILSCTECWLVLVLWNDDDDDDLHYTPDRLGCQQGG